VEGTEIECPACEEELGVLAEVMLFFLGCCGYYFKVLSRQCNLSPDYPQYFTGEKAEYCMLGETVALTPAS
jgi:hypothetical protein